MELSLYVQGASGRMGRVVKSLVENDSALVLKENFEAADVAIDFSAPAALKELLERCRQHRKPVVVGTTGHSPENIQLVQEISKEIPILFSPNFSLGMAACLEAVELLSRRLKGLCHIEIVEAHHQMKKDKPSGSAVALAKTIGQEVPIHSIRAGDIIGDHTVYFVMAGERIELKHQAQTREVFALGALYAAKFLKNKPAGLYSVKDLLYATR